ncbi:MAG: Arc family DNA-binding protein [Chloroflexi bacterium]|nr:Arc family DNA-binding protein [Chloroflexota bacterium]
MTINLSIKKVPEQVVERLRERARHHHRSLQGELLVILEESLSPRRLTVDEAYERLRASGLRTGNEAVRMVREDRDAR